jgi:hypothetical protein
LILEAFTAPIGFIGVVETTFLGVYYAK